MRTCEMSLSTRESCSPEMKFQRHQTSCLPVWKFRESVPLVHTEQLSFTKNCYNIHHDEQVVLLRMLKFFQQILPPLSLGGRKKGKLKNEFYITEMRKKEYVRKKFCLWKLFVFVCLFVCLLLLSHAMFHREQRACCLLSCCQMLNRVRFPMNMDSSPPMPEERNVL